MTTLPTIAQLKAQVLNDLTTEFEVTINPFGLSFLVAFATVKAAALWLIYLFIAAVQNNIWVDTCDTKTLIRYGRVILKRLPYDAVAGQYTLTVTGTIGAIIPGTTVYKSDDSSANPGKLFQITGAYTMPGSTGTITVIALEGGTDSLLMPGDTLTSTAPLLNVDNVATVLAQVVTPIDAEDIEDYRAKVIEKIQLVPGGWSAIDYRLVGIGVTGVLQTYAYATSGASNQVDVFLQGTDDGTPIAGSIITDYETALDLVRPLDVTPNVYASTINTVAITIVMGSFPAFSAAQKLAIKAALLTFVNRVHPFIAAADTVATRNDTVATYNLSATISQAVPGYGFSGVTFTINGTPETVWEADLGNIPYFNGTPTYA